MTLADRIADWLALAGPSTCEQIARGVRTRTAEVRDALNTDPRFTSHSGSGRGHKYGLRPHQDELGLVPGQNRASRLYEALRDRGVHSRREIFDRVGFVYTNNAASELRDQLEPHGLDVVHTVEHRIDCYQIVPLAGRASKQAVTSTALSAQEATHPGELVPAPQLFSSAA